VKPSAANPMKSDAIRDPALCEAKAIVDDGSEKSSLAKGAERKCQLEEVPN
jgi:hypothetical protein